MESKTVGDRLEAFFQNSSNGFLLRDFESILTVIIISIQDEIVDLAEGLHIRRRRCRYCPRNMSPPASLPP